LSAREQSQQSDQKLLIVIASDSDADSLIQKLVQRGYPATKVSSTGGFLRRGNATIFSGVDAEDVDNVIAIIRRSVRRGRSFCRRRGCRSRRASTRRSRWRCGPAGPSYSWSPFSGSRRR